MEQPSVLIVIPVASSLSDYTEIPERIIHLKRYLERKGIIVDVASFTLDIGTKGGMHKWIWLFETGSSTEDYAAVKLQDYDLFAISLVSEEYATNINPLQEFLGRLRKKAPTTPMVAGGLGVWTFPFQLAGAQKELDLVVYKWGETPLEFLAKRLKDGQIKHPLTEREIAKIFGVRVFEKNSPKGPLTRYVWEGLSGTQPTVSARSIPKGIYARYLRGGEPAVFMTGGWEKIPPDALCYYHKEKDYLEITTQLGCAYGKCTFCKLAKSTKHTQFDPDWVLNNIEAANPMAVKIIDACFLYKNCGNSMRILEGVKRLRQVKRLKPGFSLRYECRADAFSGKECQELLPLMAGAGTLEVLIGFESGSERVLREFRKGRLPGWASPKKKILLERNIRAIDALEEAGMPLVTGYFILASPGSEIQDMVQTLELLAYISKTAKAYQFEVTPGLLESSRVPFCIDRREDRGTRYVWPQDPLLCVLAISAQIRLDRLMAGRTYGTGSLALLEQISRLVDEFTDRNFIERLKDRPELIWEREKQARKQHSAAYYPGIEERYAQFAKAILKVYIANEKYDAELKKGVTFIEAARMENEKLKRMLETNDRDELRSIMLGKLDEKFERMVKAQK